MTIGVESLAIYLSLYLNMYDTIACLSTQVNAVAGLSLQFTNLKNWGAIAPYSTTLIHRQWKGWGYGAAAPPDFKSTP